MLEVQLRQVHLKFIIIDPGIRKRDTVQDHVSLPEVVHAHISGELDYKITSVSCCKSVKAMHHLNFDKVCVTPVCQSKSFTGLLRARPFTAGKISLDVLFEGHIVSDCN